MVSRSRLFDERGKVLRLVEDVLSIISAVDPMIDQIVINGAQGTRHPRNQNKVASQVKSIVLPRFFPWR